MIKKSDSAIYDPPKKGLPLLAVTVLKDDVIVAPLPSRRDARLYLLELRRLAKLKKPLRSLRQR